MISYRISQAILIVTATVFVGWFGYIVAQTYKADRLSTLIPAAVIGGGAVLTWAIFTVTNGKPR